MSLALFAPPTSLPADDRLPLGGAVRYTHLAVVMRWTSRKDGGWWRPVEPRGVEPPPLEPAAEDSDVDLFLSGDRGDFYTRRRDPRINKTIIVWPAAGSGVLIGLVRRAIGESHSPTKATSSPMGYDEGEIGWFDTACYVPLYAVKARLDGLGYLFCPHWAVTKEEPDGTRP